MGVPVRFLAVETGVDISKMLDSELLITFGNRANRDSLSERELRFYNELYTVLAPAKSADLKPKDN